MITKLLATKAKRSVQDLFKFVVPKVKVKVNQGTVRGCIESLPNGDTFQSFSGIPYAKPPINELRFRSPQKLEKFNENEIDCTRERDACIQKSAIWKKYFGSEDCLNLNVYVPSNASPTQKLPVMVFIHGGGLVFDSNSRDFYSPEFLLMEDVIVVTINYRLHALGFLSLPEARIPGNAGLKDQQLALEWVHENISNFNGDPEKICLFGESAGGSCVHLHMINEKSSKFINSAIMQSASAPADYFFSRNGSDRARRLAKLVAGRNILTAAECLQVLMKANPQKLFDFNVKAIGKNCNELRRGLPFIFKPVIEHESDDAFITQNPVDFIRNKKEPVNIPMIIGLNNGDGLSMANYFGNKRLHIFDNDYIRLIPMSVNVDVNSKEAEKLSKEIKHFYFGDRPIDIKNISAFADFNTDFHFTIPQTITNQLHARYHPQGNQFVFEFCFDGELNLFKKLLKMDHLPGACHFDEIFYLFESKMFDKQIARNSEAWKMRETMCKLWANFAKHGNPTPDESLPFKWKPIDVSDPNTIDFDYLKIDKEPKMQKSLNKDRMNFWKGIYDKYNGGLKNNAWNVKD